MSDQSKSAETTAACVVRSITAWSKLIFGLAANASPTFSAPKPILALVDRPLHRRERLGRMRLDLAHPGLGPEAEDPGVPEAPLGDQLGRRAASGFSTNRSTAGRRARSARPLAI